MANGKKKVRNKARDVLADYYVTNRRYTEENNQKQKACSRQTTGLKQLNASERVLTGIILLSVVGIFIKYAVIQ